MAFSILLVDDSRTMRAMIKRVIKLSGIETDNIYEAGNGREALEVIERHWVDLVLTDVHMPEMDGLEFLRRLRQSPDKMLSGMPVVVVTSEAREAPLQEALALGVKGVIRKPFKPELVREVLRQLPGGSG